MESQHEMKLSGVSVWPDAEWTESQRLRYVQDIGIRMLRDADNMTPRQSKAALKRIVCLASLDAKALEDERELIIALSLGQWR